MALSNSRWTLLRGIAQHEFESPILRTQNWAFHVNSKAPRNARGFVGSQSIWARFRAVIADLFGFRAVI
jgi:hypothetical protein